MALVGVEAEIAAGGEYRLLFWADELLRNRADRVQDCPLCGAPSATWLWYA